MRGEISGGDGTYQMREMSGGLEEPKKKEA